MDRFWLQRQIWIYIDKPWDCDDLVLRLQPNGAEGGYKVVNAKYNGTDVTIAANKGVTTALALANNTSVKFNTIATTRTDGYKVSRILRSQKA